MPLVKILKKYESAEGWGVGDIVDITNPDTLIDEGKVVLVDEKGNPMEKPGLLHCPICSYNATTALDLAQHIIDYHPRKAKQPKAVRKGIVEKKGKIEAREGLPPKEALAKVEKEGIGEMGKIGEQISDEEAVAQKERARRQRLLNLEKARAAKLARVAKRKGKKAKSA